MGDTTQGTFIHIKVGPSLPLGVGIDRRWGWGESRALAALIVQHMMEELDAWLGRGVLHSEQLYDVINSLN